MDELDKQLKELELVRLGDNGEDDVNLYYNLEDDEIAQIKQLFIKAGYIKLPNAQNITITTSDNPNDKLMTREQWDKEVNG